MRNSAAPASVRVPLADLAEQHRRLAPELEAVFGRVLRSSRFILGSEVERFEAAAAKFLDVRHAVGVSSGTDALLVALTAAGVRPGDDVVTTPFTFIATAEAILRLGARPRFADVDPATLSLEAARVAEVVSERTRAIVAVHLYGSVDRIDALQELASRNGVSLIEDAAQAFGSRHAGRAAGTWGSVGCFSFFPAKVLGALGDAGLVVTNDESLASRCRLLRQHGSNGRDEYAELGGNFRLDALQAAVLATKLGYVGEWIRLRRAHALSYDEALGDLPGLELLQRGDEWNGAIYTMRVRDGRRDALREHLRERGIETALYYARPLHLQPVLERFGFVRGAFPVSERAAEEVLSLPVHAEMSDAQVIHVIEGVRTFFGRP
jgi:dTDP-4-amino-4,6-dideoxygalactose transaminase